MSGMGSEPEDSFRRVAVEIREATTAEERVALLAWVEALANIRRGTLGPIRKARRAVSVTYRSRTVWPFVKSVWQEKRRHGWDERGFSSGFGIMTAAAGVLVLGSGWAGLAPLGDAANLPLWLVIGRGGAFADILFEEVKRP